MSDLIVLLLVGATATALATWGVFGWASARADRVRRFDADTANKIDQYRFGGANRAGVPMRVRGFDKPR